jgi:hypothetical protein
MLFPAIIRISLGSINHLGAAEHQLKYGLEIKMNFDDL